MDIFKICLGLLIRSTRRAKGRGTLESYPTAVGKVEAESYLSAAGAGTRATNGLNNSKAEKKAWKC